jgi:hypothetical protein
VEAAAADREAAAAAGWHGLSAGRVRQRTGTL